MIDFGAFQQGYSDNEKDLAARRKENAALYASFVQSNPGASADERENYAKSLAGNNKSFRAVLPTRALMESNVAEYNRKKKLAEDAAIRKRKLEDIQIAGEATNYMADLLQTSDEATASQMTKEVYGTLISDELIPSITAQANRVGWDKFQKDSNALVQNFLNNPSQANLESLKREGMNEKWGDELIKLYAPKLDQAKEMAVASARLNLLDIATKVDLDDDNIFKSQMDAEFAKYDGLLSNEDKTRIEGEARKQMGIRRNNEAEANVGVLNAIVNSMLDSVGKDGYQTDGEILRKLELEIASRPDLKGIDTDKAMGKLSKALTDARNVQLDRINSEEETKIRELTAEKLADRSYQNTEANRNLIEDIAKGSVTFDPEGKNVTADRDQKVAVLSNDIQQHLGNMGGYGLNINDTNIVAGLTRQALEFRLREQGAEFEGSGVEVQLDIKHFAQAFDEMLYSGQIDPIEAMAIKKALVRKGYNGMTDVITLGDQNFGNVVQDELKDMIRQQNDIFGQTQDTLKSVGDAALKSSDELTTQIDSTQIDNLLETGSTLLSDTVSMQNILGIRDAATQATSQLNLLVTTVDDIRAEADRLERLAMSDFYNQDRQAVEVARNQVKELNKTADELEQRAEGIATMMKNMSGRMNVSASGNPPERSAEVLPTVVANYAAQVHIEMEQARQAGGEVTPEQMAERVFQLVKSNEDLVPQITLKSPLRPDDERYNRYKPNYLAMMEMIYAEFGMTIDDIPDKYK